MKALALALLVFAAAPALAHEDADDVVLAGSSDLRDWCEARSNQQLIGEGKTPVNWTARHYEKVNTLIVEGKWRVGGNEVAVECRVARGARAEFATMRIFDA